MASPTTSTHFCPSSATNILCNFPRIFISVALLSATSLRISMYTTFETSQLEHCLRMQFISEGSPGSLHSLLSECAYRRMMHLKISSSLAKASFSARLGLNSLTLKLFETGYRSQLCQCHQSSGVAEQPFRGRPSGYVAMSVLLESDVSVLPSRQGVEKLLGRKLGVFFLLVENPLSPSHHLRGMRTMEEVAHIEQAFHASFWCHQC